MNENNKRIAKNTLLLYLRMIFTMLISLYTSRVILNTLGIEDYGIYNVVGGVVTMLSILSNSMSRAVSRFLTFELGKGDELKLKKIFSTSILIHLGLAFIILIFAETIGVWFLNHKLDIPEERMEAANWVLQSAILIFSVNIVSVPYNAAIIAHEHMKAFAYISIIEATFKLTIVFLITVLPFDSLIAYSILLAIVSILTRILYGIYCKRNFNECKHTSYFDKSLLKEMFSFAGWTFIGSSALLLRNEGVNILTNIYFGLTVNAARGIANQVNNAVGNFVTNFMTAINPQITKSYASNNYNYMINLIQQGARLSYYLLLLLSMTVLIETKELLSFWLETVPEHTVNFVRLILLLTLSESIHNPLYTAMMASGNIRTYQLVVGTIYALNFPLSYLFLELGFQPEVTFLIGTALSVICLFARLYMLKRIINLSVKTYFKVVVVNILTVTLISSIVPIFVSLTLNEGFSKLLVVCFVSVLSVSVTIFFIGCTKAERYLMITKARQIKQIYYAKIVGKLKIASN